MFFKPASAWIQLSVVSTHVSPHMGHLRTITVTVLAHVRCLSILLSIMKTQRQFEMYLCLTCRPHCDGRGNEAFTPLESACALYYSDQVSMGTVAPPFETAVMT